MCGFFFAIPPVEGGAAGSLDAVLVACFRKVGLVLDGGRREILGGVVEVVVEKEVAVEVEKEVVVEVEKDLMLWVYGAWGQGGGAEPFQLHSQLMRVAGDALVPVPHDEA